MVTVSGIAKSYGVRELFSEVSFQINREDRMALVGNNGAGKTTLFSILLEEESPDEGMITRERGIRLGYLPQETAPDSDETVIEVATTLSPEVARLRRVLRAYESGSSDDDESYHKALADLSELHVYQSEPLAKKILSGLAFKESDFDRPARELSGGWRMRAHLARLLVMKPDLLLLDEPTNHLDLESRSLVPELPRQPVPGCGFDNFPRPGIHQRGRGSNIGDSPSAPASVPGQL
jgi:ATP-binding cassette subfamily F protein 3